jgi:hypothetical protein
VPRLSIVIPSNTCFEQLEIGLASVLQHRPDDAEVVIALRGSYADPYQLEGEVRFVQAGPTASLIDAVNLGIAQSHAPFVHLLASGTEVTAGWTDAPLRCFSDPRVAAVAPLVLDAGQPDRVISTGIEYHPSGRRGARLAGQVADEASAADRLVLGPSLHAGFYRRSALESIGGEFATVVGDAQADADLALQLRALDMDCRFSGDSVVYALPDQKIARGFAAGLASERLFLRNRATEDGAATLLAHVMHVMADSAANLPRPAALTGLLGRLTAWCELGSIGRHRRRLHNLRALIAMERATARPNLKLHAPHEAATPADSKSNRPTRAGR